jgi:hypothetical protein
VVSKAASIGESLTPEGLPGWGWARPRLYPRASHIGSLPYGQDRLETRRSVRRKTERSRREGVPRPPPEGTEAPMAEPPGGRVADRSDAPGGRFVGTRDQPAIVRSAHLALRSVRVARTRWPSPDSSRSVARTDLRALGAIVKGRVPMRRHSPGDISRWLTRVPPRPELPHSPARDE